MWLSCHPSVKLISSSSHHREITEAGHGLIVMIIDLVYVCMFQIFFFVNCMLELSVVYAFLLLIEPYSLLANMA